MELRAIKLHANRRGAIERIDIIKRFIDTANQHAVDKYFLNSLGMHRCQMVPLVVIQIRPVGEIVAIDGRAVEERRERPHFEAVHKKGINPFELNRHHVCFGGTVLYPSFQGDRRRCADEIWRQADDVVVAVEAESVILKIGWSRPHGRGYPQWNRHFRSIIKISFKRAVKDNRRFRGITILCRHNGVSGIFDPGRLALRCCT